jgi:hypothetical protein
MEDILVRLEWAKELNNLRKVVEEGRMLFKDMRIAVYQEHEGEDADRFAGLLGRWEWKFEEILSLIH